MKKSLSLSAFNHVVRSRLHAEDFAQNDTDFYKNKASSQIESALHAIYNATSNHEFVTATAQAKAFIDAAYDYEFINRREKSVFEQVMSNAIRKQTFIEA